MADDLCRRCLSGQDDDHDGDCAYCARMSDNEAASYRTVVILGNALTLAVRARNEWVPRGVPRIDEKYFVDKAKALLGNDREAAIPA